MRRRADTLAFLVLSLLLVTEAAPAGGLVLCRAAGDHVAVETVAGAECHTRAAAGAAEEPGLAGLLSAAIPCVDTPLLEASSPSRQPLDAASGLAALVFGVAILPAPASAAPCAAGCSAGVAGDRTPRLLRSVVLVV